MSIKLKNLIILLSIGTSHVYSSSNDDDMYTRAYREAQERIAMREQQKKQEEEARLRMLERKQEKKRLQLVERERARTEGKLVMSGSPREKSSAALVHVKEKKVNEFTVKKQKAREEAQSRVAQRISTMKEQENQHYQLVMENKKNDQETYFAQLWQQEQNRLRQVAEMERIAQQKKALALQDLERKKQDQEKKQQELAQQKALQKEVELARRQEKLMLAQQRKERKKEAQLALQEQAAPVSQVSMRKRMQSISRSLVRKAFDNAIPVQDGSTTIAQHNSQESYQAS